MGPPATLGIALLLILLLLALDRMALNLMRPVHRPPGREPADVGLPSREWDIPGEPPLKGWWIEGGDPEGPVFLLAHGWGANGGVVLPMARAVAPVASSVVTYDVRGHGRSDRAPMVSIRQFRDDAMRAIRAVTLEKPGRAVILVGHSLGGAAGVLAAAQGAPLSAVILVATPYDVYGTIARYLEERGIPG
ncbi:MAG TPA: alpha/beta fold hydrolase, partial [Longimicrobiales bacterium]|nr:alpha/beta fold hydrolase [Longimicrobiales bacterium]